MNKFFHTLSLKIVSSFILIIFSFVTLASPAYSDNEGNDENKVSGLSAEDLGQVVSGVIDTKFPIGNQDKSVTIAFEQMSAEKYARIIKDGRYTDKDGNEHKITYDNYHTLNLTTLTRLSREDATMLAGYHSLILREHGVNIDNVNVLQPNPAKEKFVEDLQALTESIKDIHDNQNKEKRIQQLNILIQQMNRVIETENKDEKDRTPKEQKRINKYKEKIDSRLSRQRVMFLEELKMKKVDLQAALTRKEILEKKEQGDPGIYEEDIINLSDNITALQDQISKMEEYKQKIEDRTEKLDSFKDAQFKRNNNNINDAKLAEAKLAFETSDAALKKYEADLLNYKPEPAENKTKDDYISSMESKWLFEDLPSETKKNVRDMFVQFSEKGVRDLSPEDFRSIETLSGTLKQQLAQKISLRRNWQMVKENAQLAYKGFRAGTDEGMRHPVTFIFFILKFAGTVATITVPLIATGINKSVGIIPTTVAAAGSFVVGSLMDFAWSNYAEPLNEFANNPHKVLKTKLAVKDPHLIESKTKRSAAYAWNKLITSYLRIPTILRVFFTYAVVYNYPPQFMLRLWWHMVNPMGAAAPWSATYQKEFISPLGGGFALTIFGSRAVNINKARRNWGPLRLHIWANLLSLPLILGTALFVSKAAFDVKVEMVPIVRDLSFAYEAVNNFVTNLNLGLVLTGFLHFITNFIPFYEQLHKPHEALSIFLTLMVGELVWKTSMWVNTHLTTSRSRQITTLVGKADKAAIEKYYRKAWEDSAYRGDAISHQELLDTDHAKARIVLAKEAYGDENKKKEAKKIDSIPNKLKEENGSNTRYLREAAGFVLGGFASKPIRNMLRRVKEKKGSEYWFEANDLDRKASLAIVSSLTNNTKNVQAEALLKTLSRLLKSKKIDFNAVAKMTDKLGMFISDKNLHSKVQLLKRIADFNIRQKGSQKRIAVDTGACSQLAEEVIQLSEEAIRGTEYQKK